MEQLLEPVDVAVIGGGIAGVMTAYYLHRAGVSVAILEKARLGAEQSSRNWGWVRKQGRDSRELPMAIKALSLWPMLQQETSSDLGWHQGGVTYIASNEGELEAFERWLEVAKHHQLDSRMLSSAQLDAMLQHSNSGFKGAISTPSDGRAEPFVTVPKIGEYLRTCGVSIIENCAARLLDIQGGKVRGLWTEKGRIACDTVVVAGGAWTSLFLRRHGIRLPQLKVKASVMRTSELPLITQSAVGHPDAAIRRRADGGYTVARSSFSTFNITADALRYFLDFKPVVMTRLNKTKIRLGHGLFEDGSFKASWAGDEQTPFERQRVLDPIPDDRLLDDVWASAKSAFPQLRNGEIIQRWAGMIDVLPDEIPAIGPVPGKEGLFVSAGFSGHGFGIGPGAGYFLAEAIQGKGLTNELHPFRVSRFSEANGVYQGDAL